MPAGRAGFARIGLHARKAGNEQRTKEMVLAGLLGKMIYSSSNTASIASVISTLSVVLIIAS